MSSHKERFADKMEFPPATPQPNVYPLSWHSKTKNCEVWEAALRENWDPEKLPGTPWMWTATAGKSLNPSPTGGRCCRCSTPRRRRCLPEALIKTYEVHEEDPVRKCFFSVTRDEQNHEIMCGLAITKLLGHPGSADLPAQDRAGQASAKTPNGCISTAAATGMAINKPCPSTTCRAVQLFPDGRNRCGDHLQTRCTTTRVKRFSRKAFQNIGRDEGRHMAICMAVMERDYPGLDESTRRWSPSRSAPVICSCPPCCFEPPMEFWDLPEDFYRHPARS